MGKFGQGNFGEQYIKVIGEKNIGKQATISAYAKYMFSVSVNIGEENFGKELMIRQNANYSPAKTFPCTVHE